MGECCAGIDLSVKKPSGLAIICDNKLAHLELIVKDDDILRVLKSFNTRVVAIDAPLTLPRRGYMRVVDVEMHRRGFRVLPPLWRGMKPLTLRGIELAKRLESEGMEVIETHPTSALKSSYCASKEELIEKVLGIKVRGVTSDEVDAIICAIVALMYSKGRYTSVKAPDGTIILLPRIC